MTTRYAQILSFFSLLLGLSSLANAQTTYPIKCRSGSTTTFNLMVSGEFRFGFTKAPVAAGNDGNVLQPGQCSWVDRPLSANEPSYIAIQTGPNFQVGVVVPHIQNNSFKPYMYANKQQWVYDFQQKDLILTLSVYNDGQALRAINP